MTPRFNQTPIMDYVHTLEGKVRTLQEARGRISAGVFWRGFAWGIGVTAPVCWFILRHGG